MSCTTHHWPVKLASRSRHSATVRSAKAASSSSWASVLCSSSAAWSANLGRSQLGPPDGLTELDGQYRLACRQQKERECSSFVWKFRTRGFSRGAFAGGPCQGTLATSESAKAWPMAHMPGAQQ